MNFITSILEQGLIYGILALGIYITYKILDFPDLTVDGSFPLGAAITAALLTRGMNPYITLILSFLAGAVAGICTGLIHVKCKVRDLLSGNHYDDSTVDDQSLHSGNGQCAVVFTEDYFQK